MTGKDTQASVKPERAPGPRGSLIWGNLADFQQDAIGFLSDAVRDHGDIVRLRFGPVIAHLVNRPEYAEHVLAGAAGRYDKQTRSVARIRATCGNSLLSSDGPSWLRHRRLIQPVFQPRFFESLGPTIDEAIQDTLNHWQDLASREQDIDIVSEMMRLTMTIAARILFTAEIEKDAKVIERALAVILEDTWRRIEAPFDLASISPRFHRSRFRQALNDIDRIVYRIIEQRRTGGPQREDLLSRLLAAHQTQAETGLSDQELRDACVTLLLAGHETTANALAWTFFLVSQNPEVERTLHEEAVQFDSTNNMAQTRMVFSEAIRLYPSIWIIERRAIAGDQIGGFAIPRGSMVLVSPYLLHRHTQFWSDVERFDPTRFSDANVANRPRHAYLPFGIGPHKCIGEHMALMVATRIITRILSRFRLSMVPGQTTKAQPGITLRHDGELRMKLKSIPCN